MPDDDFRPTLVDVPAPEPSNRKCGRACLVEIYGRQIGRRIELGAGDVVCGRDVECGLHLDDGKVSRRHAIFRRANDGFSLQDLGSTNGTFVNNSSVRVRELAHGDQVKIGHTIFRFLCAETTEAHYHEVIYRLMTRDGLTDAFNRQAFDQAFGREVARAKRYARPLALTMFDLDHFKSINDHYGHMAGDEVLRQLAHLVSRNIRQEDIFARVGGEEFALLMPEGDLRCGCGLAERLREIIASTPFEFESRVLQTTCSFGVDELHADKDPDGEQLRRSADDRLYAAKRAGRNRVVP